MTFRITLGIDPGLSGAVAVLHDGVPKSVFDIPTIERLSGNGNEIDGKELAALFRGVLQGNPGAHIVAVMEQVNAMPSQGDGDGPRARMGASSAFRFGESFGVLKGTLDTLGIDFEIAYPQQWKKWFNLPSKKNGGVKDDGRVKALALWPQLADALKRKKDGGRADAVLIGSYGYQAGEIASP